MVGLADDMFSLKPWQKLIGQIIAGAMVVAAGVQIPALGIAAHPVIGAIGTVVWLVACANAVNLIDGVDGLAAGVGLIATATIIAASLLGGHAELAFAAAPLAGALIGFLVYNFNPGSIFLGDCGSLVIGFMLGCFGLLWSSQAPTMLGAAAPLLVLAIPLGDTSVAILRRFLRRRPIFSPDRFHIHHRLLGRGFSARGVVAILYAATAAAGILSLGLARSYGYWQAMVIATFIGAVIYGVHRLGYAEFHAARLVIFNALSRDQINTRLIVQDFQQALSEAVTPYDFWAILQDASKTFGVHQLRMRLVGQEFNCQNGPRPIRSWDIL